MFQEKHNSNTDFIKSLNKPKPHIQKLQTQACCFNKLNDVVAKVQSAYF